MAHTLVEEYKNISYSSHIGLLISAVALGIIGIVALIPGSLMSLVLAVMILFLVSYSAMLFEILFRPSQKLGHDLTDWTVEKLQYEERVFFRLGLTGAVK